MFVCTECVKNNGWDNIGLQIVISYGNCEVCGDIKECVEIPSEWLSSPDK